MTSGTPLNWGVVSTARINDNVLPEIRASDRANLLAVASRAPQRASDYAERAGIPRSYGSYDELFADPDVDCVYISLPNRLHAPVAARALRAGKHVLCEKPLAVSADEGERLFEVAARSERVLMEAFMYRHHDKTLRLAELIAAGRLGDIETIRSWFHFRAEDPGSDIRFRADLAGGALRDIGCYCTSATLFLIGAAPIGVAAVARLSDGGVDASFAGALRFPSGATAVFDCNMRAPVGLGLMVVGSAATARVQTPWYPHLAPAVIEVRGPDGAQDIVVSADNPYRLEIEHFCDVVAGAATPRIAGPETHRNLAVMDDLARAAQLPCYVVDPGEL
ncbi:MAG TPA: Gfo/Idh/MocA family oxidoreductase [Solirubrobacteraceae bacterium]|nr:Gfo/Idh/MocA family oxidoreductase [Solirubrobacteraceae bacterium]